jgi:hypothetical protein
VGERLVAWRLVNKVTGATLTLLRLRHRGDLVLVKTSHDRRARSSAG